MIIFTVKKKVDCVVSCSIIVFVNILTVKKVARLVLCFLKLHLSLIAFMIILSACEF